MGDILGPNNKLPLIKLKLDMNEIGNDGLKNLSETLCKNGILERLSLNFCNLDSESSIFI